MAKQDLTEDLKLVKDFMAEVATKVNEFFDIGIVLFYMSFSFF